MSLKILHQANKTSYQAKLTKVTNHVCKRCGKCCTLTPIEGDLALKLEKGGVKPNHENPERCYYYYEGVFDKSCRVYDLRSSACRDFRCEKLKNSKGFTEELVIKGSVIPISEANLIKFLKNWYSAFDVRGLAVLTDDVNRIGGVIAKAINLNCKIYNQGDEHKFEKYIFLDYNKSLEDLTVFNSAQLESYNSIIVSNTKLDDLGKIIKERTFFERLHSFIIIQ